MRSFDIDEHLNPIVPRPRFHYLPQLISRFFGYRPPAEVAKLSKCSQPHTSDIQVWIFAFLGGFIGISIIENVCLALPNLDNHEVPLIVASFGAAAILEYNTIESPLAQPRNLIFGHLISAVIGIGITKLFQLLPPQHFEELRWLVGALSVGTASAAMAITKTVHPPAGATALLAATNNEITQLGWWLLALILLGSSLMLVSALLVNNLYKRFPLYWWTPVDLDGLRRTRNASKQDTSAISEAENGIVLQPEESDTGSSCHYRPSDSDLHKSMTCNHPPRHDDSKSLQSTSDLTVTNSRDGAKPTTTATTFLTPSRSSKPITPRPLPLNHTSLSPNTPETELRDSRTSPIVPATMSTIEINTEAIITPVWLELSASERAILEKLRAKINQRDV